MDMRFTGETLFQWKTENGPLSLTRYASTLLARDAAEARDSVAIQRAWAVGNMFRIASIRQPPELRFITNVDHIFRSPMS